MSAADDFKAAVEARDLDAAFATLAQDVVLHSPVTFRAFEGKAAVQHVLGAVFEVFEDFRYVDHLTSPDASILLFKARVGEREIDGIDLVREDADGLIDDFTVMVRPLSGVTALAEQMAARLGAAPPA
jgi:hypothetical protein